MTPSTGARRLGGDRLQRWAIVTVALVATHGALTLMLVGDPPVLAGTPPGLRALLLLNEWFACGILAGAVCWPSHRGLRVVLSAMAGMLIGSGWVGFVGASRFPNLESLVLLIISPRLMLSHLRHLDQGLVPVMLLGVAVGITLVEWVIARVSSRTRAFGRVCFLGWIAMLPTASLLADRDRRRLGAIYDRHTGVEFAYRDYRHDLLTNVGGPVTSLAASFLGSRQVPDEVDDSLHWTASADPRETGATALLGNPEHRWNVLLVVVESMRDDVLDAPVGANATMPTLDRIASSGRRYVDSYATATQTNLAAVVPLSGTWPLRQDRVAAYPSRAAYPKVLLHDVLGPLGWRTAIFSSQNESWWGMRRFLASPHLDTLHDAEVSPERTFVPKHDDGFARFATAERRAGKLDDRETVASAVDWIARAPERPFFLALNLQASHLPYTTPGMARAGLLAGAPRFPVYFGRYPADSAAAVEAQYRRALRYVDLQLDVLRRALEASGRWDSTIVVITGDHGQAFFEHGVAAHANGVWEEQLRVPLIIRAPSLPAGRDSTPASHVDIAPTVVRLLGLPDQPAWQGQTLTELARVTPARFFMVQSPLAHRVGATAGRWKVVRDLESGTVRYTDLANDPGERLLAAPGDDPDARTLLRVLDRWRRDQLMYYASLKAMTTTYPPRFTRAADTAAGSATAPAAPAGNR